MSAPVLAWHGDRELRDRIVQRMREHRAADAIIQGDYQILDVSLPLGYRGCAIGCLLDPATAPTRDGGRGYGSWWQRVQEEFGIHADVAEAIDHVFEAHDRHADASHFAVDAAEAIPVGADLTGVVAWLDDIRDSDQVLSHEHAWELLERLRSAPVPARADR